MLISSMVACATGVKGSVMSAQELENGIKQAVMFIEQSSQLGSQAFVLAQQSLQAYLQAHSGAPAQAIRLSHFRKHQMPRVVHYTHVITEMLTGLSVRPEINSFLFNIWAEVLAVVASRHGKYHKETLALTKVVTDLIWASGSKATRRSRARVIKDMPPLLEKLRHGMTYLGLPQCRQNAHINVISAPLVDAFLSINPRIALTALSKQNQTTQPNDKTPPSRLMPSLHDDDEHAVEVLESHTDSDWSLFDPNLKQ